ncbi:MAG: ribosome silencing factor [Proteobacteria bacterium]|jgi:ribosome-associated protein|nr:ribosome silencing factor [Desulfocapsa sp.]MBU3943424.1 ribosome silencing factor [Pseudomonadota bacterium]MBU3982771.1 ribosome silencing factor [Pseudomonadota bacterium]MBU4030430.1 ribosome silencing factor [Pseudomonadota bacterium]MBU4043997.1 ribosome silencing factor [Pseudomonadota bacterium]
MQRLKKEYQDKSGLELARICARVALDAKAEDLVVLDVKGISSFTDYFVIMNGRSTRHVQGLAETIEAEMRSKRINASHAEGMQEGMWVLLDFDDVVVHIFYHEQRKFYDLEGLWHDARPVNIDDLLTLS